MKGSRVSDYDFALPSRLIAQEPAARRDESRLLVVHRASGTLEHRTFRDIVDLVPGGDALVVNTTKVIRARLLGARDSGAPAEVLLLKAHDPYTYEAMVHPGAKLKPGRMVTINTALSVEIGESTERGTRLVRLHTVLEPSEAIERFGHVPLPPYMERDDRPDDAERYQTVYAREAGSVAAPTAGLHFTPAVLEAMAARGVRRAEVLLHVGAGTFRPITVDDPAEHVMHEEWYRVAPDAAATLNAVKDEGRNIWAVGTTSMRTLESAVRDDRRFTATEGDTALFIRPPYAFRAVDHLLTNFHLPKSTLVMLVAAFAGYDLTMHAYHEAIRHDYRFFSYGDAMLLV
ncbi:MAG: tRNA preQ1(34) S-adenosylmethionine ribosyltransferase-isomerase QueA [Gemmatimonadaceae bacterium]|nr:tRNA preQ1(34) S-adenosylmethionine ribosyltransferase-isomerase QueA [Gemmatimonadaceae bacterium]